MNKNTNTQNNRELANDGSAGRNPGVIAYNICIIIIDLIFVLGKFFYYTFQAFWRNIRGIEEKDITNDIVLITGSGHGIGRELALQYSSHGATVICWDINEKLNSETVGKIKALGRKAFGYTVDITDRTKVLDMASKVQQDVGTVTILVNNAGIMPQHDFLKHTEQEIRSIFEINVLAHFWTMEAFLPTMIKENRGHIVAMSSMAGLIGFQNLVPYCGSKFAVRGIMEAMSEELRAISSGKSQIKFTTVFPYMVDTGLCKRTKIRFDNIMKLVTPEEAAAAIISGQRRDIDELSIPRYLYYLNTAIRNFSVEAATQIRDFFETGVESDM